MRSKKSSPSSYPSPTERRQGAVHPLLMQLMQSKLEQHSLLLELQQASAVGKSPRSERETPASKQTRSQQMMAYANGADLHEVVMQALAQNDVADGRPDDTPAGAGGSATAARAKEREQQQKELKQALAQCTVVDASESSTVRDTAMALREVDKRELFERLHSEQLACKGLGLPPEKSSCAKDVAEATFTPKLNKQTQELVREMWDGVPRMSRIEYLYRQGVEKSRKLERRPKMRDSGVTLGPRTEPADYTNGAELFPWKHADHYLNAMRDEREEKDVMENCTFSPKINRNSKQYSKSYGRTPLLQRCSHWKLEREMKLKKERAKKETEDFAECTFQPAISNNISTLTLQEAQRMRLMRSLSPGHQLSKYHIEGSSWGDKWQSGLGRSRTMFHSSPSPDRPKSAPSLRSPLVAKTKSDGSVIPIHEHLHMTSIGNRKIFEDLPSQDVESVASLRRSLKYSPVRMKPEEENRLRSTVSSITCSETTAVTAADADDDLPGILALLSQPQPPKPGDLEFEDKHCKRLSAAREQRNKKAEILNKYSGSTWSQEVTRPKEFKFAVKSRTGRIKSLKAPVTAENSPFNSLMRSSTSMNSPYRPVTPRS